jgi:tRNA threonylcarbamoyladenosine biosynthesis protein TsaB
VIVLALDAAMGAFSAALTEDGSVLAAEEIPGNVALENGLGALAGILRRAGIQAARINRVGVGIGPGSFTGVRIAISYAKSLAQGWNVPLSGVNTFDAIEAGLPPEEPLLAVVRGRRGVVSIRYRSAGAPEQRDSGYVKDVLDRLKAPLGPLRVAGDTQDVVAALAERGWSVEPVARAVTPTAVAVALIAGEREPARTFHEVRADYGELPPARVPDFAVREDAQ